MRNFLLAISFLLPLLSQGQATIGIEAGMNLASIRFKDYKPPKRILPGFNADVFMQIPFDEKWSFKTGLRYSGKGVIYERTPSTGRIDSFTIRLNYIELPLMIAYRLSPEKTSGLVLSAGPTVGYGFNGRIRVNHSNRPPTIHLHREETDQYKRIEIGYEFCTEYRINNRYGVRFHLCGSLLNIQRADKEWNRVYGFSFYRNFSRK